MRSFGHFFVAATAGFASVDAFAELPGDACPRPVAAFHISSPHTLSNDFMAALTSLGMPACYGTGSSVAVTEALAENLMANSLAFNTIDVQTPDEAGVVHVTVNVNGTLPETTSIFKPLRPGEVDLSVSKIVGIPSEGSRVKLFAALSGKSASSLKTGLSVIWLRDGSAVPGADGIDYLLTGEDVGAVISARVSVLGADGRPQVTKLVSMSQPVQEVEKLPYLDSLEITGIPAAGNELTVLYEFTDPNPSDAEGDTGIVWLRDNKVISGAVGPSYVLQPADIGKQISVRVIPRSDDGLEGRAEIAVLPRRIAGSAKVVETLRKPDTPPKVIAEGLTFRPGDTELFTGLSYEASGLLTEQDFAAVTQDLQGRKIDRDLMRELLERVNALYLERGYELSRALLPQQQIAGGIVRLQLVEAKIGALEVKDADRLSPSFIMRSLGIQPGDWISLSALETSLRRYNATNKSKITTEVAAGSEFGETDVFIKVQEPDFVELPSLRADNYASDVSGFNQQSLNMTFNNVLGHDDETTISYLDSRGTRSASLSFSMPLNTSGTNLSLSATKSNTRFVEDGPGASDTVGTRGDSYVNTIGISHPLYFDDKLAVFGAFSIADSYSDVTLINSLEKLTETKITKLSVSLPVSYEADRFKMSLTPSANMLDTSTKSEVFGALNDDWLQVYKLDGSASRYINKYLTVSGRFESAYTSDKRSLNFPSEVITIGGPRSVRAYQPGASSGMKGYLVSLEARSELANWGLVTLPEWMPSVQPYIFYDYAFAQSRADIRSREDYWSGYGIGVSIPVLTDYLSFDIYHARALDSSVHEAQKEAARDEPVKFSLVARIKFNDDKE
ncbi:MAG: ShlB/FhaC/HecB family hemolysin secretion/activation protein [Parvibaculales bacterium]